MKLSKKILSIVLAAIMAFSMMPITALAWDTGNLTFVKMDNSWDGYAGKYSAYVHNGANNDFIGIVLKEVNSDGTITVNKGSSFDITLSCGTWTSNTSPNGVLPNNTLSWHYGNNDTNYVISSVDSAGSGLTYWKAFLGDDTTKEIQSAIEGEFATAATPSDSFRARASEGGTNEAYGVFKFTPTSFPELNTVGEYTVRLAPTLVMNKWEGGWLSKKWQPKYGWGNYQWSIDQGSPDTSRTIAITVKVVCPHTNTELRNKADANCTTAGYSGDSYCTDCGAKLSTGSTINALGHDYQIDSITYQAPTCTVAGKQADQFCTRCNDTKTGAVIPATGTHSYTVEKEAAIPATCTTTGKTAVMKCATCDLTTGGEEIAIDPDAHVYGQLIEDLGDCETDAVSYQTCTLCGYENIISTTPAPGHQYQELADTAKPATCTEDGKEADRYCPVCEETFTGATIKATGHTPVTDEAKAPTCTETGLTQGSHCSVCNEVLLAQEPVDALGHSFTNYVSNNNATCTGNATETAKCDRCDATDTRDIADSATGHSYTSAVTQPTCTEQGYTTYTCSVCDDTYKGDYTDALGHTEVIDEAVAATCTTTGLTEGKHCSVCNEVLVAQQVVDALGHTEVIDEAEEATCTLTGLTEGKHCSVCNAVLVAQTVTDIDPDNHTDIVIDMPLNPTCTDTGFTEGSHCGECRTVLVEQQVLNALGHDYQEVEGTAVAPTCTVAGKKADKECSRCGDTVSGAEIPATDHSFTNYVYNNDATKEADGTETATCDNGCGEKHTRTAVGTKLPEITIDVVDRENAATDTSSKVDVVISKDAENNTVVNAEIKPEEEANGTKFIGWYDNEGNLVSSNPEYVVTDTSKPLTVKTADKANDGYSLGMNGTIDCNLYIDTLYYVDDVANTKIKLSYNINNTTYDRVEQEIEYTDVLNSGIEFAKKVNYAPAQISEEITYTVIENGVVVHTQKASIEKYCAAVINAGTYSDELTNLCQSVINYGSAAQGYFEGVTAPAVTTATTEVANLTAADVEAYKPTIQQTSASKADFQVTDMTFMSLDNSAIRFYYTGSLDGYTVTVDGAEVTPQSKVVNDKTYNYFEVSGIAAADLDELHDIRITKDSKIAFYAKASALSYVYLGVTGAPGALQNYKTFLATLVDYNVKNKEYKASKA